MTEIEEAYKIKKERLDVITRVHGESQVALKEGKIKKAETLLTMEKSLLDDEIRHRLDIHLFNFNYFKTLYRKSWFNKKKYLKLAMNEKDWFKRFLTNLTYEKEWKKRHNIKD